MRDLVTILTKACHKLADTAEEARAIPVTALPRLPTKLPSPRQSPSESHFVGCGSSPGAGFICPAAGGTAGVVPTQSQVVSVEEAMTHIRQNRLFTGAWETNLATRRVRVGQISASYQGPSIPRCAKASPTTSRSASTIPWLESIALSAGDPPVRHDVMSMVGQNMRNRNVADWRFVSISCPSSSTFLVRTRPATIPCPLQRAHRDERIPWPPQRPRWWNEPPWTVKMA